MSILFIAKICSCYFGKRLFAVATTRVTTVSRQQAIVLIYDQFQSTTKDQIVESIDATAGPYSQRKLFVRTLITRSSLQFSKSQVQTSKI